MNKVIVSIILFALCIGLVVSVIIPITTEIRTGGEKTFMTVKQTNNNIMPDP